MHRSDSAEDSDRLLLGRVLSHYRIDERIGVGGMGVVYRARDERLERDVAIKVLPSGAILKDGSRLRFQREARALAKLSHPNIGAVFEFDEQEGIDFIVMELVEGTSLHERLKAGPIEPSELTEIGAQLAAGLGAAHRAGVVHRDLKPANIRINTERVVKILDFGLAKLLEGEEDDVSQEPLTATAGVVGTLPYMAPEQILGRPVDARSDVYATGTILYEMAVGRRPFPVSPEVGLVDSILWSPPEPPSRRNKAISRSLDVVILRALEKEPVDRYQSADELHDDLRRLSGALSGPLSASLRRPRKGWSRRLWLAAIPLVLVAAAFGIYWATSGHSPLESLAVMPFRNDTGDATRQFMADGITEGLILRLSQLKNLKVIARSSVFRYKGKRADPRKIGRDLGVRAVLIGRLFLEKKQAAVSAELVDVSDGRLIWGIRRVAETGSLGLQEAIAAELAQRLRPRLGKVARKRLAMPDTRNEQAQKVYLRGLQQLYASGQSAGRKALSYFQKAIEIDPLYALAHAGLARAYYHLSNLWLPPREAMPRARAAAHRALELNPKLAQAHVILATVLGFFDRNWKGSDQSFRRALELNPSYAVAYHHYGILQTVRARFEEAQKAFDRARELDPLSTSIAVTSCWPALYRGRYQKALGQIRKIISVQPDYSHAHALLSRVYLGLGQHQQALASVRKTRELGGPPSYLSDEIGILAAMGRTEEAKEKLSELMGAAEKAHVSAYSLARAHLYLGMLDKGYALLNKSFDARDEGLVLIAIDSRLEKVWKDRRLHDFIRKLGLWDAFSRVRAIHASKE